MKFKIGLIVIAMLTSISAETFGIGKWSVLAGAQQEASFGSTYNAQINYTGFEVNEYWFVELGIGAGLFRVDNRSEIQRVRWYENDLYFNTDFSLNYLISGFNKSLESSFRPYLAFGATSTYVGGKYQIGGLLGLGAISYFNTTKTKWGIRYGVIDRLYVPDLGQANSITHNFFIYTGFQYDL